jgi:hypothetical protein
MMRHLYLIRIIALLRLLCWFFGSVYFVWVVSQQVRVLISETDSLPQHYFLHLPKIKPKLNNYTVVWSDWYSGKVIKKIVGISGDRIWRDQNNQMVVNNLTIGIPEQIASDGRRLHATPAQIIPNEYVFLYSSHIKSFDSRYQELGLVPLSKLQGLVIPLI